MGVVIVCECQVHGGVDNSTLENLLSLLLVWLLVCYVLKGNN